MKGFRKLLFWGLLSSLMACSSGPVEDDDLILDIESGAPFDQTGSFDAGFDEFDDFTFDSSSGDFSDDLDFSLGDFEAANDDFADFESFDFAQDDWAFGESAQMANEFQDMGEFADPGEDLFADFSDDLDFGDDAFAFDVPPPVIDEGAAFTDAADPFDAGFDDFTTMDDPFADDLAWDWDDTPQVSPEPIPMTPSTPVAETELEDDWSFSEPAPPAARPSASRRITNISFRAHEEGGTVVIDADGPLTYETRANPSLNQWVIEVPDAHLPDRLKRPLNTRDFAGVVGSIDAYQTPGSTTARIVVQMREGSLEPVIEAQGNSILMMASKPGLELARRDETVSVVPEGAVLSSRSVDDFLRSNTQFFGEPISLEVSDMDIREALKFISDESGVNMIISDEVQGSVSLKLREVPWDQALVVLMRTKRLGYTRQGNVLRIAPLSELRDEEEEAARTAESRRTLEPLMVQIIPISYANVAEIAEKMQEFLSDGRGRVAADPRTGSLVVTDTSESLSRIRELIRSLDTPPGQVLIEGKIVEASETFTREVGVNWGFQGGQLDLGGGGPQGPLVMRPSMNVNAGDNLISRQFGLGLNIGTLDFFGNLSAALALNEAQGRVKVISSPRVVTMHNEEAEILQSTEIPLLSTNIQDGIRTTAVEFKPVSLSLKVTPQITADGSVIMDVDVNREFAGPIVESATQARPINRRGAKTKVLVNNGQTAVIGGIYQTDTAESERGLPWVRRLPVIGSLFRNESESRDKLELLLFLTPRILSQPQQSGIISHRVGEASDVY